MLMLGWLGAFLKMETNSQYKLIELCVITPPKKTPKKPVASLVKAAPFNTQRPNKPLCRKSSTVQSQGLV